VSNPEFLREGCAMMDFLVPDRIVVGSGSQEGLALMRRVYAPLTLRGHRLLAFDAIETSEMIKYASNIFLATKIGLINEFALLCEKVGADVEDLAIGVGLDKRIGAAGLKAGPGFGGSCFPKDLRALVRTASDAGSAMPIAEAVILSNERQKTAMVHRIIDRLDGDVRHLRIAVLGLSFKAGTDDVREAPAITVIDGLIDAGAEVVAHDPAAMDNFAHLLPDVDMAGTAEEALLDADAVVLLTEWADYPQLPWAELRQTMARPLVIDLRNHLDGALLTGLGYEYVGLGRTPLPPETALADSLQQPIAAE
ncbi:MAG: UDP-glucose/GDP-mannose dehydrogenase family protein, partial [Hyphomicrobiales bacterium]